MASVEPIRISVLRQFGTWQTRCGEAVGTYETESDAVAAAITQARELGREGRFAYVVMRALTSVYGPTGLIRTLPTRGRPAPRQEEREPEKPSASVEPPVAPTVESPPKDGDSAVPAVEAPVPPTRFTRIAAALAREAENRRSPRKPTRPSKRSPARRKRRKSSG
jgi:hypothetical protein